MESPNPLDPTPAEAAEPTPAEQLDPVEQSETTFDADTVRRLRAEAAENRVKAKAIQAEANARLLVHVIAADGRLIDPDVLALSDDLLDEAGYVDSSKVADAITTTIADKPYLSAHKPHTVIPQGARDAAPAMPNIGDLIRARM